MPRKNPKVVLDEVNINLGDEAVVRMVNGVFMKNTLPNTYDDFDDEKFLSNVNHYVKTKEFKKFITSRVSE